jgi:hypothetical protein
LRHWAIRRSSGCGVAGAAEWRAFQQSVQQLALRLVKAVDQPGDLLCTLGGIFQGHLADMPRQAGSGVGSQPQLDIAPDQRALL